MYINIGKETTKEFPFYGVVREARGTVIHCAKPVNNVCTDCIFNKECAICAGEVLK